MLLGFFVFIFIIIILEFNRRHNFVALTSFLYRWRTVLILLFFIIGIGDFILLQLSNVPDNCDWNLPDTPNCPLLNPDEYHVRLIGRILTTIVGILFGLLLFGYWESVSYLFAHSSFAISLLYMTIIGYIFVQIARVLSPPATKEEQKNGEWTWHQYHNGSDILDIIVKFMIFVVFFFVVMGAIILALFGDIATSAGNFGTINAIILFACIAHVIMITPLAPGSVVDVCAGFLMVSLFVENNGFTVFQAWASAFGITIILHFSGSCAQYYCGKIRAVQIWGNRTLPPEMLAASDSVLKHANFFQVGIVGQVFMDTANGLNQGRMNMKFCTQFWSEWASIPSAFSLVSLGAVLAIPSFDHGINEQYKWAEDALPLIAMMASIWQGIASSWGAKELLSSTKTTKYWTALEKWNIIQYFYSKGYVPTKEGWKEDVYQLSTSKDNNLPSMFELLKTAHDKKNTNDDSKESRIRLKSIKDTCKSMCSKPEDPLAIRREIQNQRKASEEAELLRQQHYTRIEGILPDLVDKKLLTKINIEPKTVGIFEDYNSNSMYILHGIIVLLIFGCGIASYLFVAWPIGISDAVQIGIKVLGPSNVKIYGWISFILFWILVCNYYCKEIITNFRTCGSGIIFVFTCCKIDKAWETVFDTPEYMEFGDKDMELVVSVSDKDVELTEAAPVKEDKVAADNVVNTTGTVAAVNVANVVMG